jgi:hypothetical protein
MSDSLGTNWSAPQTPNIERPISNLNTPWRINGSEVVTQPGRPEEGSAAIADALGVGDWAKQPTVSIERPAQGPMFQANNPAAQAVKPQIQRPMGIVGQPWNAQPQDSIYDKINTDELARAMDAFSGRNRR